MSCEDIKSIVEKLSPEVRDALEMQVMSQPRALNLFGVLGGNGGNGSGGNILTNIVSGLLSNLNLSGVDHLLLGTLATVTNVLGRSEYGFEVDSSWNCLIEVFSSE